MDVGKPPGNREIPHPDSLKLPLIPIHLYIQRLLKGESPLRTRLQSQRTVPSEILSIPAKHRRTISDPFTVEKHGAKGKRKDGGMLSEGKLMPMRIIAMDGVRTARGGRESALNCREGIRLGERPISTARLLSINTSPRQITSIRSEEILEFRHTCRAARSTVRKERRIVRRKQKEFLLGLRRCSVAVDNALNLDVNGYIPKELAEYKKRRAEERAARGVSPLVLKHINLKKEVVSEYRREMLRKALQRNLDKDMRYIYTFGTCSALGT